MVFAPPVHVSRRPTPVVGMYSVAELAADAYPIKAKHLEQLKIEGVLSDNATTWDAIYRQTLGVG